MTLVGLPGGSNCETPVSLASQRVRIRPPGGSTGVAEEIEVRGSGGVGKAGAGCIPVEPGTPFSSSIVTAQVLLVPPVIPPGGDYATYTVSSIWVLAPEMNAAVGAAACTA